MSAVFRDVLALVVRFRAQHREDDQLCQKRSGSVEKYVMESASARWQKTLMQLIQTRDQRRAEYSYR